MMSHFFILHDITQINFYVKTVKIKCLNLFENIYKLQLRYCLQGNSWHQETEVISSLLFCLLRLAVDLSTLTNQTLRVFLRKM